ncbi:AaceriABL067Cp [[Ashbya] aceris (nom. inval.)]|nr:AaceriABL067Cp [[Ashbya] aceris (nom. inval.)]
MSSGSALIGFTLGQLFSCATIGAPPPGADKLLLASMLVATAVATIWLWVCTQRSAFCALVLVLAAHHLWEEGYLPLWQPAPALPPPPPLPLNARAREGDAARAREVRRALLQFRRESAVPLVNIRATRPRGPRPSASSRPAPAHRPCDIRIHGQRAQPSTSGLQAKTAHRAAVARSVHVQPGFGIRLSVMPPSFSDSACKATLSNVRASAQPFIYRH